MAHKNSHLYISPEYQLGATLLEVLVALIVLSLGCLVAAGLQATSQKTNHDSQQRLIATFLVNDIIEKMRANPQGIVNYATAVALTGTTIKTEPIATCSNISKPCSASELAAHDLWEWEQAIAGAAIQASKVNTGGLIQPTGCISINGGSVRVVLSWFGVDALSDTGLESGVGNCGNASANRRQVLINTFISSS